MASAGRPKRDLSFPKSAVKRANERLRKLESVHSGFFYKPDKDTPGYYIKGIQFDWSSMSSAYRNIEKYANRPGTANKPQIYKINEKTGAITFINKTQYDQLDEKGKKYFQDMLNQFLEDQTSTKIGVEQAYIDAFEKFKKNNPQFEKMSFEDYMLAWKTYDDKVKADESDHFSYGMIQTLIEDGTFSAAAIESLSADQVNKTRKYMSNIAAQTTNGVGGKFVIDHKPIMNTSMSGVKFRGLNGRGR